VILPDTSSNYAMAVEEKLRSGVDGTIYDDGNNEYHITASCEVTTVKPVIIDDFKTSALVSQADTALYGAKESGRNKVSLFSEKKKWYKF